MAAQVVPTTPQTASAPSQTTPIPSRSSTIATTKKTQYQTLKPEQYSEQYRSSFAKLGPNAPPPMPPPDKYHSIHSLEESKKVEALKDTKLNPNLIKDGYDQLSHGLYLWSITGAKAKAAPNISFDEQAKIASNFYDTVIAPAYGHLNKESGIVPMSKELWMKQAYNEALDYKIEDAYKNDWTTSLKHGWNSALAATARAAFRVTTAAGSALDDVVSQYRKEAAFRALPDAQRQAQLVKPWHEQIKDFNNQVAPKTELDENAVQRGARYQDTHHQFWADALPAHDGFLNKTTSFVAEQAGQLPVFAAMMLGGEAAGVGAEASNLTKTLFATPAGQRVAGYLMAGAEGLAYGTATRKQDDPGEIWRDAVGFTVFHGLFDVAGVGTKKLIDMFPSGSEQMERLKQRQDAYVLAQEGKRPATAVELYHDHVNETANNISVAGITGQRSIFVDALHHVAEFEHQSPEAQKAAEAQYLNDDPARWSPVLAASKYIRSLLGEQKISDIKEGSEEEKFLSSRIAQLTIDAASKMNTHAAGLKEATEASAEQKLLQPSAKHTMDYYVSKVQADMAKNPGAAALVSKEQVQKAAAKMYAADLQKAAEQAEEEAEPPKTEKAQNIAKRRKDAPAQKIRSEYKEDRFGQPSVRYSVNPDYKVRLQAHQRAAKIVNKTLPAYFRDLSDEDFGHDLSQYFYPKVLRNARVFFEHQNTKEGMQNPNFLAFMSNYTNQMPQEFGQELQERLIDTMKVQKYMNGRKPTEPQIDYYAKSMYNHMDNFLGSGRWPKENNLFRSSNDNIFKTTRWQRQLLVEKTIQEQKNLKSMFSRNPKAMALALKTHAAFSKLRMNEFQQAAPERNSQELIQGYDNIIANLQTKTGKYDRWDY